MLDDILQQSIHDLAGGGIVVHDEHAQPADFLGMTLRAPLLVPMPVQAVKVKVVPAPGSLSNARSGRPSARPAGGKWSGRVRCRRACA